MIASVRKPLHARLALEFPCTGLRRNRIKSFKQQLMQVDQLFACHNCRWAARIVGHIAPTLMRFYMALKCPEFFVSVEGLPATLANIGPLLMGFNSRVYRYFKPLPNFLVADPRITSARPSELHLKPRIRRVFPSVNVTEILFHPSKEPDICAPSLAAQRCLQA